MANPQAEDGHVDIANEIVDQLCRTNLTAYEWRVLWFILRKTYGWHKKSEWISYSQFEKGTGLKRWHIGRTLKMLALRCVITITPLGNGVTPLGNAYGFQKDYARWQPLPRQVTSHALPREVMKPLPHQVTTKEKKERSSSSQDFLQYIETLRSRFPLIAFDLEFEKFWLYWNEGNKKCKNYKLALLNWMTKAESDRNEHLKGWDAEGRNVKGKRLKPSSDPEEFRRRYGYLIKKQP